MPYVFKNNRADIAKLTQHIGIWMSKSLQSDYGTQKKIINEIVSKMDGIKNFDITLRE